mmetsp:Transcript_82179/g.133352  ORF Transcript_82179/g.133352 Transcript_82179/m.133352 type:complete len:217 (-) Transcript_82179:169-819(-)
MSSNASASSNGSRENTQTMSRRLGSEVVDLCDDRETMEKRPRLESGQNCPVVRQPLASLQGSSGNWVSWRNAEGHLVMAERQQPSSQGGEEDSDDELCAITAVTRVDDPVASFDLCGEEDEATKAHTHAHAAAATATSGPVSRMLWEDTKKWVDQICAASPGTYLQDLQMDKLTLDTWYSGQKIAPAITTKLRLQIKLIMDKKRNAQRLASRNNVQ